MQDDLKSCKGAFRFRIVGFLLIVGPFIPIAIYWFFKLKGV